MKPVSTLTDPAEAQLLAERLRIEGVPAEVRAPGPGDPGKGQLQVTVRESDFKRARKIVARLDAEAGKPPAATLPSSTMPPPARKSEPRGPVALILSAVVVGLLHNYHAVYEQALTSFRISSAAHSAPSPLPAAAGSGDIAAVQRLLGRGENVDGRTPDNQTALMRAAQRGDAAICALLIGRGANVNARDNGGHAALVYAGLQTKTEVMDLLLDNGANTELRDNEGRTPLMFLAQEGARRDALAVLLRRGALVFARDPDGRTAQKLARRSPRGDLAAILMLDEEEQKHPRRE